MSESATIHEDTAIFDVGQILAPALLLAVSLALRLPFMDMPLWIDERITLSFVRQFSPWELLITLPRTQPHYPLWYLVVDSVGQVTNPVGARWISLAAGVSTPLVVYRWAQDLPIPVSPFTAGVLVALSPVAVVQSYWLRMYSPLILGVALSWAAAWYAVRGRARWRWYGVAAVPTACLHPFGALTVGIQLAWVGLEAVLARRPAVEQFNRVHVAVAMVVVVAGGTIAAKFLWPASAGSVEQVAHVSLPANPLLHAAVLPLASLTGSLILPYQTTAVLWASSVCCAVAWENKWLHSQHGRLLAMWVLLPVAVLSTANMLHPVLILKYISFIVPGAALALSQLVKGGSVSRLAVGSVILLQIAALFIRIFEGSFVSHIVFPTP